MFHKSGRNDTQNPGSSTSTPCGHTLKEYIALKEAQIHRDLQATLTEYERGYQNGWHDAHVKIKAGE